MSALSQNDARMDIRLPAGQKAEIERAAQAQNRSLTEFATTILTEAGAKCWRNMSAMHTSHFPTVTVTVSWPCWMRTPPQSGVRSRQQRYRRHVA